MPDEVSNSSINKSYLAYTYSREELADLLKKALIELEYLDLRDYEADEPNEDKPPKSRRDWLEYLSSAN